MATREKQALDDRGTEPSNGQAAKSTQRGQ